MMGMIEEVYRLPMVPMKPENRAKLEKVLAAQGLLRRALPFSPQFPAMLAFSIARGESKR